MGDPAKFKQRLAGAAVAAVLVSDATQAQLAYVTGVAGGMLASGCSRADVARWAQAGKIGF